jgi:predicted AAA+ superfamily ATPase
MPHLRTRYALAKLKKKLKFARVVAIQGPRQCGKSILATRLLEGDGLQPEVVRFDDSRIRLFARNNPDLFLLEHQKAHPLILDEAQKAPEIFDAIKLRVDQNLAPGQYLLLGSTEFSTLFKVREALTGRMSRLRLHPLSLAEAHRLKQHPGDLASGLLHSKPRLSLAKVLQGLEHGGMPGVFAVRDAEERLSLLDDWVQLTCTRDVHQIPKMRLDSEIARAVLEQVAQNHDPELAPISRELGESPKVVAKYLRAFEELYVIERLKPHTMGTGKDRFYLCDVGIAGFLGASRERKLETWLLQEFLIKKDLLTIPSRMAIHHYRNPKGSRIPFVIHMKESNQYHLIKPLYAEKADLRDVKLLESLGAKIGASASLTLLLADPAFRKLGAADVHSWSAVV